MSRKQLFKKTDARKNRRATKAAIFHQRFDAIPRRHKVKQVDPWGYW